MTTESAQGSGAGDLWSSQNVASVWQSGAAARGQTLGPVTELMLNLAGVGPGNRVLDVGAGTGDQTLLAAQRVGPDGFVLATDISGAMLDGAREATRAAGLQHVETQAVAAQHLELEPASFDVAIARFSLMFVPDPGQALVRVQRALKPGGKLAAVTWGETTRNPFRAMPQAIASRLAGRPFPEPGPGQWGLADATVLAGLFERAGFHDVEVRPVTVSWQFPTLEEALENNRVGSPPFVKLLEALPEADHATIWAELAEAFRPFVGSGGFEAPGEALLTVGTA